MDGVKLFQVLLVFHLFIATLEKNPTILKANNCISKMKKVNCMRDKHSSLSSELAHYQMLKYPLLDICIKSRQRVIHQNELLVYIDCASETNSRLLPATQVDSFLTYLGHISRWEYLDVSAELADLDCLQVLGFVVSFIEQNVIANSLVLYPWSLSAE